MPIVLVTPQETELGGLQSEVFLGNNRILYVKKKLKQGLGAVVQVFAKQELGLMFNPQDCQTNKQKLEDNDTFHFSVIFLRCSEKCCHKERK
jgi:hypothetical protein